MISLKSLAVRDASALRFVSERLDRLHRRIQQFVEGGQYAGVSLLLLRNGVVADSFAVGFRNLFRPTNRSRFNTCLPTLPGRNFGKNASHFRDNRSSSFLV
jgi:hypothetical protein